jgi:hypothetical protein
MLYNTKQVDDGLIKNGLVNTGMHVKAPGRIQTETYRSMRYREFPRDKLEQNRMFNAPHPRSFCPCDPGSGNGFPSSPIKINSFTIDGAANPVEVGTVFNSPILRWNVTPVSLITSMTVRDDFETLQTDMLPTDTNVMVSKPYTSNVPGTQDFYLDAYYGYEGSKVTENAKIQWWTRMYYGENIADSLWSEADVKSLRVNLLAGDTTGMKGTFIETLGYKYFAIPVFFNIAFFQDANSIFEVPMIMQPTPINVLNANGVTVAYNIYRSFNQLNGAMTIQPKE